MMWPALSSTKPEPSDCVCCGVEKGACPQYAPPLAVDQKFAPTENDCEGVWRHGRISGAGKICDSHGRVDKIRS